MADDILPEDVPGMLGVPPELLIPEGFEFTLSSRGYSAKWLRQTVSYGLAIEFVAVVDLFIEPFGSFVIGSETYTNDTDTRQQIETQITVPAGQTDLDFIGYREPPEPDPEARPIGNILFKSFIASTEKFQENFSEITESDLGTNSYGDTTSGTFSTPDNDWVIPLLANGDSMRYLDFNISNGLTFAIQSNTYRVWPDGYYDLFPQTSIDGVFSDTTQLQLEVDFDVLEEVTGFAPFELAFGMWLTGINGNYLWVHLRGDGAIPNGHPGYLTSEPPLSEVGVGGGGSFIYLDASMVNTVDNPIDLSQYDEYLGGGIDMAFLEFYFKSFMG